MCTDICRVYLMWQNPSNLSLSNLYNIFFSISFIWSLLIILPSVLYSINIKQTEENVECVATPMTLQSHERMKAVEFIPVE